MLRKEKSQFLGASARIDVDSINFTDSEEIEKIIEQDWLIEEMQIQFNEFRAKEAAVDLETIEKRIKTFLSYFLKNIQAESEFENFIGILGLEQLYLLVVEVLERMKST